MRNCTRLKEREGKTEVQRPWSCGTSTVTKWKEEMKAFKKKKERKGRVRNRSEPEQWSIVLAKRKEG